MKTVLINMLSRKAGRNIATPHGCEWLCHDIAACTNESISVNTLKRLTGVLKDYNDGKIHLRGANKDILARYLGYKEWSDFCSQFQHSASDETCASAQPDYWTETWDSVKPSYKTVPGASIKSDAQGKTKDSAEPIICVRSCKSDVHYSKRMKVDNMTKKRMKVDNMDKKFLGRSA